MQHARVRVALVTGANRGIGFEVCRQLAAAGFVVLLTVREATKAQAAAEALSSVGRVEPLVLDVANADSIAKAAEEVASQYNCLDVLINNAGIHYDTWEKVEDADIEGTVTEAIRTNLLGPWRTSKAFLPLLRRSRAGRIVNGVIRSRLAGEDGWGSTCVPSDEGGPECPDPALLETRILVNAMCPGWVATEMGGAGGRPVEDGAAGIIWAATLPDGGPTGGFFRDGRRCRGETFVIDMASPNSSLNKATETGITS